MKHETSSHRFVFRKRISDEAHPYSDAICRNPSNFPWPRRSAAASERKVHDAARQNAGPATRVTLAGPPSEGTPRRVERIEKIGESDQCASLQQQPTGLRASAMTGSTTPAPAAAAGPQSVPAGATTVGRPAARRECGRHCRMPVAPSPGAMNCRRPRRGDTSIDGNARLKVTATMTKNAVFGFVVGHRAFGECNGTAVQCGRKTVGDAAGHAPASVDGRLPGEPPATRPRPLLQPTAPPAPPADTVDRHQGHEHGENQTESDARTADRLTHRPPGAARRPHRRSAQPSATRRSAAPAPRIGSAVGRTPAAPAIGSAVGRAA